MIVPYGIRLGEIPFEKLLASSCNRMLAVYPNGKTRRYDGGALGRLEYNMAYRSMCRYLRDLKGAQILEVGCSDGLTFDMLSNLGPKKVIGLDTLASVGFFLRT